MAEEAKQCSQTEDTHDEEDDGRPEGDDRGSTGPTYHMLCGWGVITQTTKAGRCIDVGLVMGCIGEREEEQEGGREGDWWMVLLP